MALRRAVNYVRGFVAEWREFNRLHQPMPDPAPSPSEAAEAAAQAAAKQRRRRLTAKHLLSLSWRDHVEVWRMAGLLWYEALRNPRDPVVVATVRELTGKNQEDDGTLEKLAKELGISESDMAAFAKTLRKNFRANERRVTRNLKDLHQLVTEHREELKEAARDRLTLMNTSMQAFMEGYREARDAEREKVLTDKHHVKELWDFLDQALSKDSTKKATTSEEAKEASSHRQEQQQDQQDGATSSNAAQESKRSAASAEKS